MSRLFHNNMQMRLLITVLRWIKESWNNWHECQWWLLPLLTWDWQPLSMLSMMQSSPSSVSPSLSFFVIVVYIVMTSLSFLLLSLLLLSPLLLLLICFHYCQCWLWRSKTELHRLPQVDLLSIEMTYMLRVMRHNSLILLFTSLFAYIELAHILILTKILQDAFIR